MKAFKKHEQIKKVKWSKWLLVAMFCLWFLVSFVHANDHHDTTQNCQVCHQLGQYSLEVSYVEAIGPHPTCNLTIIEINDRGPADKKTHSDYFLRGPPLSTTSLSAS